MPHRPQRTSLALAAALLALAPSCATPASGGDMTVRPADLLALPDHRMPRPGSVAIDLDSYRVRRSSGCS